MNDQWLPSLPSPPQPASNPFPPGNTWNSVAGCSVSPDQPSFVYGVVITGIPAAIGAPYAWSITLNDGANPPNFTIDHYDASGNLLDHPLTFSGVDGSARFNDPVTAPSLAITTGQLYVPSADQLTIPGGPIGSYLGSASPSGSLAWFNLPAPPIPTDAPSDGNLYGRTNGGWSSGGIFTQPLYINGANSLALVGPNQTQRSIMAGTGTPTTASWRWQLLLADQTSESGGNTGSNFALNALADSGNLMPGPSALAITRANNAAVFGGTITAPGQTGNAPAVIINKTNSSFANAVAGQTNGSMRWQVTLGDPSAELGNNFGSNFTIQRFQDSGAGFPLPLPFTINRSTGNAVFGYGLTVTGVLSLAAPANLSIAGGSPDQVLITDGAGNLSWADQSGGGGGGGGIGEAPVDGTSYARNDATWVHLSSADITDWAAQLANYYPTSNPAGYQTAAQVTAALGAYLPLTGGVLTGPLGLNGTAANRAIVGQTNGINRWAAYYGDTTAEVGGATGSNFVLQSYADNGATLATPLSITRQGVATFSQLPSFPGGSSGQVLSTNGAGALSWANMAGSGSVTISDTPPPSPQPGALWWDSVGGQLYIFYNDGSSSQWVIAVNAATAGSVTIGVVPPANPMVGALWWDSVGAQLYVWYNDGNSQQWAPTTNQMGGNYLPLSGGTTTGPVSLKGVTDGSNAAAGQVGEYLTATGSSVALPASTGTTVASLTLTAGDWDVWGNLQFSGATMANIAAILTGGTPTLGGYNQLQMGSASIVSAIMAVTPMRISLAASQTIVLQGNPGNYSGSATGTGAIMARRAR